VLNFTIATFVRMKTVQWGTQSAHWHHLWPCWSITDTDSFLWTFKDRAEL